MEEAEELEEVSDSDGELDDDSGFPSVTRNDPRPRRRRRLDERVEKLVVFRVEAFRVRRRSCPVTSSGTVACSRFWRGNKNKKR